jgi:guanylate kinase
MKKNPNLLKKGQRLFVVSAPSGAGKTTLCNELIKQTPKLSLAISHTTRPPRPGEKNGKHYYFLTQAKFVRCLARNKMAEWTEIYGYCYGTSKETIQKEMHKGHDILLDIDERGACQLLEQYPDTVTILVLPPSLNDLKKRLLERGSEDKQSVTKRLQKAKEEIAKMAWYQYVVINDRFEDALYRLKSIIIAERCRNTHALIKPMVKNSSRR